MTEQTLNRAQRRAVSKAKPMPAPRRIPVTPAIDEFEQFDDIERLMQKLDHGAIEMAQGRPVMTTKGVTYDVLSAIGGWMDYWLDLAEKHGWRIYDDSAMRKLAARLEAGMMLTPKIVDEARLVVNLQRAMFRAIPRNAISSQATTTQIKLLIEDREAA